MKIGSLFSGYGGLDLGVQSVLGGTTAWHCDFDTGPTKVLEHHWPDVPNLVDVTKVDWAAVEPVDVITGGSPCQDVSAAGKRAGMRAGTRSGLWASMCDAIDTIRPSLVVWENVRGAYSAAADSNVEPCPICVGDSERVHLRALGRVLGDLAELGYDAWWTGVRAADAGAPHSRFRVFVYAWPTADTYGVRRGAGVEDDGSRESDDARSAALAAADSSGDRRERRRSARDGSSGPAHDDLAAPDTLSGGRDRGPRTPGRSEVERAAVGGTGSGTQWGSYAPAIDRWERVTGRPAPAPTEPGRTGQPRLSPAFVEWLMGLPAGHVTAVPGLTRNEQLKLLGNGVVPQQAALATRMWLDWTGAQGVAA